ncbi:hypothetical protein Glove_202g62 [Diversispora epigaea]|uniref:DUF659 domain-containing protein n=1 Tax=Diversispora epigaea TaxID=1348612 RepID=A0A397IU64_9GLOM|nr:hypothetical protein Glove_202g62 [Diversispora epigaea]
MLKQSTCKYCKKKWNKGSPQELEAHLANNCLSVSPEVHEIFLNIIIKKIENSSKKRKIDANQLKISDFHKSTKLTPERINEINRSLIKAFVICGISWHIIENHFFIEFLKTFRPAYEPPSREVLSDVLLSQKTAVVNFRIIKKLKDQSNLTLACDRWSNPSNKSIWNFVVYTADHYEYLWSLRNLSDKSHTNEFLINKLENVLEKIGHEKFSAIVHLEIFYVGADHYEYLWSLRNLSDKSHTNEFLINKLENVLEKIGHEKFSAIVHLEIFYVGGQTLKDYAHEFGVKEDCFLRLARLGAAIKNLPENDHRIFKQECIQIFNKRFAEFEDNAWLVCFFLHPGFCAHVWARAWNCVPISHLDI